MLAGGGHRSAVQVFSFREAVEEVVLERSGIETFRALSTTLFSWLAEICGLNICVDNGVERRE